MQIETLIITQIDTQISRYDNKKEKWIDLKKPKITKQILYKKENVYDGFDLIKDLEYWSNLADHQGTTIEVTFKIRKDY